MVLLALIFDRPGLAKGRSPPPTELTVPLES